MICEKDFVPNDPKYGKTCGHNCGGKLAGFINSLKRNGNRVSVKILMKKERQSCIGCGSKFTGNKRKYCTKDCRIESIARAQGMRKREDILAEAACNQTHDCLVCGKIFKPKRAGFTKACSRECGWKISGYINALKKMGGRVFVRTLIRKKKKLPSDHPPTPKYCKRCNTGFYPMIKHQRFCSFDCKEENQRRSRRIAKSARRAKIRGAQVEHVDPIKVFDRDAWRCKICHKKTPKAYRGSTRDLAPELDHILPLSKGGEHSYANTQCTCRKCNQMKGDTVYGQIPLFSMV